MISRKLNLEFIAIKESIVEAYIAVGMITEKQFDFFIRNIHSASTISIITGIHMPTPPSVFVKLREAETLNKLTAVVYADKYFHPKLYLFRLINNKWVAFVGSGNFTNGGWFENEELFIQVNDDTTCKSLKDKFYHWFSQSQRISQDFINYYTSTFIANEPKQAETKKNIQLLLDHLNNRFNIENVDFRDQFFSREHHDAFAPGKTHLETVPILEERTHTRSRLYELNDLLIQAFPVKWNIYPHYVDEHIVSHIQNNFHHDFNVRGLWVAYGRNQHMLKQYGSWATPLEFMRMQVIVGYDYVGVWLMPGKSGSGQVDRENFARQMQNQQYRDSFYTLLKGLGDNYWIELSNDERTVTSFNSSDELHEYTRQDNWRHYYFIIGRNYELGSMHLRLENIIQTIISDFSKFYPIYDLIIDKTIF